MIFVSLISIQYVREALGFYNSPNFRERRLDATSQ